jgi:oligoribonuclease
VTAEEAAAGLLEYVKRWVPEPKRARIAGSSVHFDRSFLRKEPYKEVHDYLSHRIFDVSVLAEAVSRWSPVELAQGAPGKRYVHNAKDDILESLAEARYYRQAVFCRASEDGGWPRVVKALMALYVVLLVMFFVMLGIALGRDT